MPGTFASHALIPARDMPGLHWLLGMMQKFLMYGHLLWGALKAFIFQMQP